MAIRNLNSTTILKLVLLIMVVSSCGGANNQNNSTAGGADSPQASNALPKIPSPASLVPTIGNTHLSLITPVAYPLNATQIPVVIQNTTQDTINAIEYTVTDVSSGASLTLSHDYQVKCQQIIAAQTCRMWLTITKPAVHSGIISLTAKFTYAQQPRQLTRSISLIQVPPLNITGVDGIYLLHPQQLKKDYPITQMLVTAIIPQNQAINYNRVNLVDNYGNLLNAQPLETNTGFYFSPLAPGQILNFLVEIPNAKNFKFKPQLAMDDKILPPAQTSHNVTILDPAQHEQLLEAAPSRLTIESAQDQPILKLTNLGEESITEINVNIISPLTTTSNTCQQGLGANSSCQIQLKLDPATTWTSTSGVSINYLTAGRYHTLILPVDYTSDAATAQIIVNNNFNSQLANSLANSQTSGIISITNAGSQPIFDLNFKTTTTFIQGKFKDINQPCKPGTSLAAQASCNLMLLYNSSQLQNGTSLFSVNYANQAKGAQQTTTIPLSYQTNPDAAILRLSATRLAISNPINVDNSDHAKDILQLTNSGDALLDDLEIKLQTPTNQFNLDDSNCSKGLAAGNSCYVALQFGPFHPLDQVTTGLATNQLIINYNDASGSSMVRLPVTGIISDAQQPQLVVLQTAPTGFNFGDRVENLPYLTIPGADSSSLNFTITNFGPTPATNVYLNASYSNEWQLNNQCGSPDSPGSLEANGGSCTFSYQLVSTSSGIDQLDFRGKDYLTLHWTGNQIDVTQALNLFDTLAAGRTEVIPINVSSSPTTIFDSGQSITITLALNLGMLATPESVSLSKDSLALLTKNHITPSATSCNLHTTPPKPNLVCRIYLTSSDSTPDGNYQLDLTSSGPLALTATKVEFTVNKMLTTSRDGDILPGESFTLTYKNTSKQILDFNVNLPQGFSSSNTHCHLQANDSCTISIKIAPNLKLGKYRIQAQGANKQIYHNDDFEIKKYSLIYFANKEVTTPLVRCSIAQDSGDLIRCTNLTLPAPLPAGRVGALKFNSNGTKVYLALNYPDSTYVNGGLAICDVNHDNGEFSNCNYESIFAAAVYNSPPRMLFPVTDYRSIELSPYNDLAYLSATVGEDMRNPADGTPATQGMLLTCTLDHGDFSHNPQQPACANNDLKIIANCPEMEVHSYLGIFSDPTAITLLPACKKDFDDINHYKINRLLAYSQSRNSNLPAGYAGVLYATSSGSLIRYFLNQESATINPASLSTDNTIIPPNPSIGGNGLALLPTYDQIAIVNTQDSQGYVSVCSINLNSSVTKCHTYQDPALVANHLSDILVWQSYLYILNDSITANRTFLNKCQLLSDQKKLSCDPQPTLNPSGSFSPQAMAILSR